MKYATFPPPPHLARYVRFFWVLEGEVAPGTPYVYRSLADGCAELLFHYRSRFDEIAPDGSTDKSFLSGIHGPGRHYRRFSVPHSFGIFGVYLYPFALPRMLSVSGTELIDQMPDLQSVFGREGNDLEEQIMLAAGHTERVRILSRFLTAKLTRPSKTPVAVENCITHLIRTQAATDVGTLAREGFLSVRQFERHFKQLTGFGPKLFSRIIRFHAALDHYPRNLNPLTQIALDCGYYDQSHFIHDFKAFSGHHPKHYFSGQAEGSEYRSTES